MIAPAPVIAFSVPVPLTHCVACGDPLYAEAPLRTVAGGAMHVGCFVMAASRPAESSAPTDP